MTHIESDPDSPTGQLLMAVGAPVPGEILARRYRLDEHISNDVHGRQVWRGIDMVLRRPVAIVLRQPGGSSASEMISAAAAASRITHPHLLDVYDAFDEGTRAYVVREWVDGRSLRQLVMAGPLDPSRATAVAHAVASAVAAAHATAMVHGNVHPGTVLIADDGRVVLADARTDESATAERDVRAIGAVLYCALTGHWPYQEAGIDRLPDGMRDANGMLASPRQVRGGLPSYLSELAMDLLNPYITPPTAEALAVELGRLDTADSDELFGDTGPLGFSASGRGTGPDGRSSNGRKVAIGLVALVAVAAAGLLMATKFGTGVTSSPPATRPTPSASGSLPSGQPTTIPIDASQVRVIDPAGNGQELSGVDATVDGDETTGWHSDWYTRPNFGNIKPGMGILVDLGKVTNVTTVEIDFASPGATVEARVGSSDPGPGRGNDAKIVSSYQRIGSPQVAGSTAMLPIGVPTRYILIWVTSLPPLSPGKYEVGIQEISVHSQ